MFWTLVLWVVSFALQILLTPKPQDAKKASLDDFEAPTAEEGREIPVLFGTKAITGPNVVWYGHLKSDAIKGARRYGFFGPRQTTGYKYSIGMHLGICHGPADKITEIRVGEKTVWSGTSTGGGIFIDKEKIFGGTEREGGVRGTVDIEMGGPAQDQNDYLLARLGAGVPAFRGVVCAVLRQVYIGTSTYLKNWDFRIQRIYVTSAGAEQWYPEKAGVAGGFRLQWYQSSLDGNDKARMGLEFLDVSSVSLGDVQWADYAAPVSWSLRTNIAVVPEGAATVRVWMDYKRYDGANIDAYIDEISISVNGTGLTILNASAETGTTANWTTTVGGLAIRSSSPAPRVGTKYFGGGDGHSRTTAYQDVSLSAVSAELAVIESLDMNPAHIIRECLTDRLWGMGYTGADMDDDAFALAADTLFSEGFGLTLLWQREEEVSGFITTVLSHIDAVLYTSRSTGKFILKLIRADYSIDDLLVVDEDDIISWGEIKRRQASEAVNSVNVQYTDVERVKDGSIAVHNTAQILQSGGIISTSRSYPGITFKELAIRVGTRDVRALGAGLTDGQIVCKRTVEGLNPGDPFRLVSTKQGFSGEIMRAMETRHGDGRTNGITIKFLQDVFHLDAEVVVDDSSTDAEDLSQDPVPVDPRLVHEIPYQQLLETVGRTQVATLLEDDPDFGDIQMAGSVSITDSLSAGIFVDAGTGYVENSDDLHYCPTATLVSDLGGTATDTAITIENEMNIEFLVIGLLASIGDEIVRVTDLTGNTLTMERGCLDTVPRTHLLGAPVVFFDGLASTDLETYTATDVVDVKLLCISSRGEMPIADATADTVTMASRAIRPYPPGNYKVDGSYAPGAIGATATLTWVDRDRVLQSTDIVPHSAAGIGPEAGVEYVVNVYGLDVLGDVITGVAFLTVNVAGLLTYVYNQGTDPAPGGTDKVRLVVSSLRDGYVSWQSPAIEASI